MQTSLKTHLLTMLNAGIAYEKHQALEHDSIFASASSKISDEHSKRARYLIEAQKRIQDQEFKNS